MQKDEIFNWMKKYNFKQLLMWIQVTAVHPNNQLYQLRFEYLLACLLSIKPSEFLQEPLDSKSFEKFIFNYFKRVDRQFAHLEDFEAYNQLKLIPYFYNGEKYYFFYGALERPREFIEKFDWMYLKIDIDNVIQNNLEELFKASLSFQTDLLEAIASNSESQISKKSLYVPSEEYLDLISKHFYCANVDKSHCIFSGDFKDSLMQANNTECSVLFDKLFIKDTDGEAYFIIPQMHIEVIFRIGDNLLYADNNKKANLERVTNEIAIQLRESCEGFFSRFNVLEDILDITKNSLVGTNEIAVRIADNQIILFHLLRARHNSVFNMETGITIVKSRIEKINSNDMIGLKYPFYSDSSIPLVPTEAMEITGVIVFEHTGINCPFFGVNNIDINFFTFLDLKRLFEHLDSGEEFIRYLRERVFVHSNMRVSIMDALDEFAYYLQNGKKFLESGKMPNFASFVPHQWHDYYMDFLYNKYKDDVYEIIEKLSPYYYDKVIKQGEHTYEICNRQMLMGGIFLNLHRILVMIEYPIHMFAISSREAVRIGEKFLKPMISEYLIKLETQYIALLEQFSCEIRDIMNFELCPIEEINQNAKLRFLSEHLYAICDKKPFVITVRWNTRNQQKYVFFIYDTDKLHNVFASEDNSGERMFLFELTKSLLDFYCGHLSTEEVEKTAKDFVEVNLPLSRRRYGMGLTQSRNPRLPEYKDYEKHNQTDISSINRSVAVHLLQVGYEHGKYEGEKAKKVNSEIYNFLQGLLEKEIRKYNIHLLEYAYTQLEFIEGKRERNKVQYAIDSLTDTDFDVVEKHVNERKELSQLSVAVKHIISSMLKTGLYGNKAITKLDWEKLLAITTVLTETTMLYELDEYNLIPYSISITDMFEINDDVGNYLFDSEKLQYEECRISVNSAKTKFQSNNVNLQDPRNDNDPKSANSVVPEGVNSIFKLKYGFTFYELINILASLGMMDLERDLFFPINIIDKDALVQEVSNNFPEFSIDSIENCIDFVCLSFSTYSQDEDLIISRLMRKKERLNLCPIISLGDGKLLYGNQMCLVSSSLWVNSILAGDYPYSINCPDEIVTEMKKIHKQQDDELEYKIEDIAKSVVGEKYVEARLGKFTKISRQLPKNPPCGEIDLIVALLEPKILLVADAKNINKRVRPYDIKLELKTFFDGEKCYTKKLQKKKEFVFENMDIFLDYFGINDKYGWNVTTAFVVNHVYSSAFMGSEIKFVLVEEFDEYLHSLCNKS